MAIVTTSKGYVKCERTLNYILIEMQRLITICEDSSTSLYIKEKAKRRLLLLSNVNNPATLFRNKPKVVHNQQES